MIPIIEEGAKCFMACSSLQVTLKDNTFNYFCGYWHEPWDAMTHRCNPGDKCVAVERILAVRKKKMKED